MPAFMLSRTRGGRVVYTVLNAGEDLRHEVLATSDDQIRDLNQPLAVAGSDVSAYAAERAPAGRRRRAGSSSAGDL